MDWLCLFFRSHIHASVCSRACAFALHKCLLCRRGKVVSLRNPVCSLTRCLPPSVAAQANEVSASARTDGGANAPAEIKKSKPANGNHRSVELPSPTRQHKSRQPPRRQCVSGRKRGALSETNQANLRGSRGSPFKFYVHSWLSPESPA